MQKLLTPSELAELTGLALQTIYNRHSTGGSLPPCIRLGNRLRFRMPDVDLWLEECSGPNAGPPRAPGIAKIPTARSKTMGKERHGTKEAKKEAVLTKKEKKTAKQVKKQAKDVIHPLIPH